MTDPYTDRYRVGATGTAVVVTFDGDSGPWLHLVAEQLRLARGSEAMRRRAQQRPPAYDVAPIVTQLRDLRHDMGVTCKTVGDLMGVFRSRISDYELGRYDPRVGQVLTPWAYVLGQDLALVPRNNAPQQ